MAKKIIEKTPISQDKPFLTYYSATLYQKDIELLEPRRFFNDALISFYFEYLSHKYPKIMFFSPSLWMMCQHLPLKESQFIFQSLGAFESKYILCPINNNSNPEKVAGGDHWSLFFFDRNNLAFYHFDSANGYNFKDASKCISQSISKILKCPSFSIKSVLSIPQQKNGFDCGLFVIGYAKSIAEQIFTSTIDSLEISIPSRKSLKKLITQLEKEKSDWI